MEYMKLIKKNAWEYINLPEFAKDNKELLLESLKYDVSIIEYASDKLKKDLDVLNTIIKSKVKMGLPFEFMPTDFIQNHIEKCIDLHGHALEFATIRQTDCDFLVWKAIKKQASSVQFASTRLRSNFEVGMYVVSNDASSLDYLSSSLRSNPAIVRTSIENSGAIALQSADKSLRDSDIFIDSLMTIDRNCLYFASERIQNKYEEIK